MPKRKGNYCNVEGCFSRSEDDESISERHYYRLPAVIINQGEHCKELSSERRRLWLSQLNQNFEGKTLTNIRVCSDHFINKKRADLYMKDSPDWVPTVNMTAESRNKQDFKSPAVNDRYERNKTRNEKARAAKSNAELFGASSYCSEHEIVQDVSDNDIGCEVQTDIDQPLFLAMQSELQVLRTDNMNLREDIIGISSKFKINEFERDDDKVKYFTGLPKFTVLLALFTFLEAHIPVKQSLEKFQILMMCLMRLRLNLPIQFLAYQFHVSPSTVSRYFSEMIEMMYIRLKPLVNWPEREQLRKTMPMSFRKHFGTKVAVIIDCFEVFVETPSNILARAKTWSNYKHHNTVKFLIGATPQGSVSYISPAWGGRVSDKFITEHCGFLSNILPGDLILADRGFDIADTMGSMCAEARIPAFTKGKNQLSPLDIESTRKLANCRIQVERVIGTVRQKYTILSSTLPLEFLHCKLGEEATQIDKISHICCSLVNMCPSIVDFN